jgi:high-affinity nickel-transport protein
MSKAYGWAFDHPLRKMYYNMTTTGLSVFVALLVGTVEYLQVISSHLGLDDRGFFYWINNTLDFETLGYVIVATFLVAWLGSVTWYKWRRIEERWAHMIPDEPGVSAGAQ